MRKASSKLCAAFTAGVLAFAMAGCASTGASSGNGTGDNSSIGETSAESYDEQTFTTVTFGAYEQDGSEGNGAEAIEWYVLDEQDGKSLLISKYVLDAIAYSDVDEGVVWSSSSPRPTTDVEWADSSLRAWLNGEFLESAFDSNERASIQTTTNTDTKNNATHTARTAADSSVHQAKQTDDKVFLLSVAEAKSYFHNNAARAAKPTEYALGKGVYTGIATDASGQVDEARSGMAVWWLRTNGYYAGYESVVTDDGYVHGDGYRINGEVHDGFENHGHEASELGGNMGVRPCIWVDTSALS